MNATDKLIEAFASKLMSLGVPIREDENKTRMDLLEAKVAKAVAAIVRLVSWRRVLFLPCDVAGISLFAWQSDSSLYIEEASARKGSLSELLIPAGYVQIGQPDTGSFDAVCFDLKEQRQNRECRIVQVDHEDILCNWRVRVSGELWPSFIKLVEGVLSGAEPQVFYEDPNE